MAFEHGLDEVGVEGGARSRQVTAATETRLVGCRPIASHVHQLETNGPFIWAKEKQVVNITVLILSVPSLTNKFLMSQFSPSTTQVSPTIVNILVLSVNVSGFSNKL